jgi:hypothetical protein
MVQWNRGSVALMIVIAALLVIAGGFADVANAAHFPEVTNLTSWGW